MTGESLAEISRPAISVILPVFNGAKFIDVAICSILDQSFRNFELLAIDDGSTDGTLAILKKYRSIDKRVIVVSRANRGLVKTLNEGLSLATGFWIARMDADDIALPSRFERQLHWLERSGADICGSWIEFFGTSDKRIVRHPESDEAIKLEMLFGSPFAHSTVMMKAGLVSKLGYSEEWESCEDYDLWERAARAGWKMTNVPEVLLSYRLHASQVSSVAAVRQRELSQQIRFRYWAFMRDSLPIDPRGVKAVLSLRESPVRKADMDRVDSTFGALLNQFHGESRATIFHHMTRLYLRAAGDCRDVVGRWRRLNNQYGIGSGLTVQFELFVLSLFRVRPDTKLHGRLRQIYSYFGR